MAYHLFDTTLAIVERVFDVEKRREVVFGIRGEFFGPLIGPSNGRGREHVITIVSSAGASHFQVRLGKISCIGRKIKGEALGEFVAALNIYSPGVVKLVAGPSVVVSDPGIESSRELQARIFCRVVSASGHVSIKTFGTIRFGCKKVIVIAFSDSE